MKSTLWQPALPFTFKGGLLRSQVQASSTPHPSCSRSSAIDRLGCRRECRRVELRSSKLRRRHTRDYAYCLSPFMRPEPTIGRRLRKAQGRSRWRINSACMQERIHVPSLAASSHRRELRASRLLQAANASASFPFPAHKRIVSRQIPAFRMAGGMARLCMSLAALLLVAGACAQLDPTTGHIKPTPGVPRYNPEAWNAAYKVTFSNFPLTKTATSPPDHVESDGCSSEGFDTTPVSSIRVVSRMHS